LRLVALRQQRANARFIDARLVEADEDQVNRNPLLEFDKLTGPEAIGIPPAAAIGEATSKRIIKSVNT
jgi:adenine/guanine phosphoribosyltransferase-like PRPP-binding protein